MSDFDTPLVSITDARAHVSFGSECGRLRGDTVRGDVYACGACYTKHLIECAERVEVGDVTEMKPFEPESMGTSRTRGPKGPVHAARRRSRRAANRRARTARRRNR